MLEFQASHFSAVDDGAERGAGVAFSGLQERGQNQYPRHKKARTRRASCWFDFILR